MNLALHCKRMVGEIRRDMVRTGGDMQTAAANQTGLTRLFLAPPARLELTTFRLGVWRAASYIVRFIICLIV